ncbi:hypothetical protein HPB51_023529 [Rhipicephalus microplus]|uniref:Uncharacterized protein n=1 Tax=Rhipicephalus microplus TaxID=6941 RepID=A0A9J6F805_RHIMP|nr:hypothetical protein HPB51_023529 [Rhipicephalus microplus]
MGLKHFHFHRPCNRSSRDSIPQPAGAGVGTTLRGVTMYLLLYFDKYKATATAIKNIGHGRSRDTRGSYDNLYILFAGLNLGVAVLHTVLIFQVTTGRRRRLPDA